ncbi:bacteriophage antitermination protein Q [Klebsiella pneumoniae]|uniref:bacteriophage antitermination protein Q n=1 Tax=Klebsiella pneumoniae TaxID=573 RepID=UPI001CF25364|nr:bacteriophage antitermination protein Q [Klebsiella pneumoniae]
MTSLKTSIKTITYLSDIGCLEIHGASLDYKKRWLLMKSRCLHLNSIALFNAAEKRSEIINRHCTGSANVPVPADYAQEAR